MDLLSAEPLHHAIGEYRAGGAEDGIPGCRRKQGRCSTQARAHAPRHAGNDIPNPAMPEIAIVSAKDFVASVTRQCHSYMTPRELGDQEGGDLRRVGERFIE